MLEYDQNVREKIKNVPDKPGCYIWKDGEGNILYVGKAINLNKRMAQYFREDNLPKTISLIQHVRDFDYIVVNNEVEALNLEYSLIRKNQPKYNILLRSGSNYPYIILTNEKHPQLRFVYNVKKTKRSDLIFGPFPRGFAIYSLFQLLNSEFPFRKCKMEARPCLYSHLGQCIACNGQGTPERYEELKKKLKGVLKGSSREFRDMVKERMEKAAERGEFELAIKYRTVFQHLETITQKQDVTFEDKVARDFIGLFIKDQYLSISLMITRNGEIIGKANFLAETVEEPSEALAQYLQQFYASNVLPVEIVVNEGIDLNDFALANSVTIVNPKIGTKKMMLETSNAQAKEDYEREFNNFIYNKEKSEAIKNQLQKLLNIKDASYVEMFDNSHLGGDNPVSSMVAFIDGQPAKHLYRKFIVDAANSKDDYMMMEDVIYRRYRRVLADKLRRPDIIIVDGGKGQISSALKSLNQLGIEITLIGLKKNDKHQTEAIVTAYGQEIPIDKSSDLYKFLYRVQEEVHNFAISFQAKRQSKKMLASSLDGISGLGPKAKDKLMQAFEFEANIKQAPLDELIKVIGPKLGLLVYGKLHENDAELDEYDEEQAE